MSAHVAQLLEQAKWAIEQAKKRGADGSRITAERTTTSSVEWRDGKVDRVKESTSLSLGYLQVAHARSVAGSWRTDRTVCSEDSGSPASPGFLAAPPAVGFSRYHMPPEKPAAGKPLHPPSVCR